MTEQTISYPRAPQIAGNPKEAEQYIGRLVRENARLTRLLMRCHVHATDGMGGSANYAMDRLFQIQKLTRKFVSDRP